MIIVTKSTKWIYFYWTVLWNWSHKPIAKIISLSDPSILIVTETGESRYETHFAMWGTGGSGIFSQLLLGSSKRLKRSLWNQLLNKYSFFTSSHDEKRTTKSMSSSFSFQIDFKSNAFKMRNNVTNVCLYCICPFLLMFANVLQYLPEFANVY